MNPKVRQMQQRIVMRVGLAYLGLVPLSYVLAQQSEPRATFELKGATDGAWSLAFSADGKLLASCRFENTVQLWDPATRRVKAAYPGHGHILLGVAFDSAGKLVALGEVEHEAGTFTGKMRLWDVATGKERAALNAAPGFVWSFAFSGGGKLLALEMRDGTVKLWDVATGRQKGTLEGNTGKDKVGGKGFAGDFSSLAFGGDNLLAWVNNKGDVKIWDAGTGREKSVLKWHFGNGVYGGVLSLAFSSDGRLLALGGLDGTVKLWDVATGQVKTILKAATYGVGSLAFSSDGKLLASSGSREKTIKIWHVPSAERATEQRRHQMKR